MYKLAALTAEDFADIYDHILLKFGKAQAELYTEALEAFFDTLAQMTAIGEGISVCAGIMKIELHRHTPFYMVRDTNILFVHIFFISK